MTKVTPKIISSVSMPREESESESETTWVFKSLMDVVANSSTSSSSRNASTKSSTLLEGILTDSTSKINSPDNKNSAQNNKVIRKNSTAQSIKRPSSSNNVISHEKIAFPDFTLFNDAPKKKKTRLPPPSELFKTEKNSNYFNNTEEELLKEREEAEAKRLEQSILFQFFKRLDDFQKNEELLYPRYSVDTFANVSELLEKLSIHLVSDKIQGIYSFDSFGLANRSFFKWYNAATNSNNQSKDFWFDGYSSIRNGLDMHTLLKLFNELPTKASFYFKHKKFTLTQLNESTSVRKAVLFSNFFKSLAIKSNTTSITLLSSVQFSFFKTISSSIEMALIGSSAYNILHSCKYDEALPLDSFKNETNFFMRLPNLLFLLFNSVFENTLQLPSLVYRQRLVPYNTRTMVLNFFSLGNTKLDSSHLARLRLTEKTNIGFLKKLGSFDNRDMHLYFDRLELSRDMVSKVQTLILDTSMIGTFWNSTFLKLKQLNSDLFMLKQSIALSPYYSSDITAPKRNISIWVLQKKWVVKLSKYNLFLKSSLATIKSNNTIQSGLGIVSVVEVLDQLADELELMAIRLNNKTTRLAKKIQKINYTLSPLNFSNLFERRRKKQYFLKFQKQKKILKADSLSSPKTGVYTSLKKKVSSTTSMYTKLQNTTNSSFFYSLCLDRSRLLSKFRNHLIKKGLKLKATNSFLEILNFIKSMYRLCPVKVMRFLLLRHYKATLVTELFIKKRKVFVPKQLSLRKQIYYMIFSFLKEASLRSNVRNFSYKKNEKKMSRFMFSMENYIDSLMHDFLDGTSTYLVDKNRLIEEKVYSTKQYLIPSSTNRSRLRNKFSMYSGH